MPLGAARISFLALSATVEAEAEVIRKKVGVSAVGNAQVDTAQSKFGGASVYFDGANDYVKLHNISLDTDEWTVEGWIRADTWTASTSTLFRYHDSSDSYSWGCFVRNTGIIGINKGGTTDGSTVLSTDTWYHVALVRSSDTMKIYIDGTLELSRSNSTDTSNGFIYLGNDPGFSTDYDGWIDEVRISNTARYTTGFTPSTTPFVNDNNTLLLLHMDGTDGSTFFEDDNGTRAKVGVSAYGNAHIELDQYKFGRTSLALDGNNDALIVPSSQGFDFSGDFTFEAWIRKDSTSGNEKIFDFRGITDSTYTPFNEGAVSLSSSLLIDINGDDFRVFVGGSNRVTGTNQLSAATWHHIAVCRTSGTVSAYFDGTQQFTYSDSTDYSSVFDYAQPIGVAGTDGGFDWTGYMDEIRWSNTGRYTTSFTPSTTQFTNDEDTVLLLHMEGTDNGTDIIDDNGKGRAGIGASVAGDVVVDTAQSKFGGASAYFAGTLDYLSLSTAMGASDFTLDFWWRPTSRFGNYPCMTSSVGGSFNSNGEWAFYDRHAGANTKFRFYWRESGAFQYLESTTTVSNGTWYHLAVQRDGTTLKLFVNGTEEDSTTSSQSFDTGQPIYIGTETTNESNGHVDEYRISDIARYTSDFTPETTPYQNDANTVLLLHMDGTNGSTTFIDDNGTYSE
jgi:hypothetical protein